eukprot:7115120-Pyramimonas_sp.AAC.1
MVVRGLSGVSRASYKPLEAIVVAFGLWLSIVAVLVELRRWARSTNEERRRCKDHYGTTLASRFPCFATCSGCIPFESGAQAIPSCRAGSPDASRPDHQQATTDK